MESLRPDRTFEPARTLAAAWLALASRAGGAQPAISRVQKDDDMADDARERAANATTRAEQAERRAEEARRHADLDAEQGNDEHAEMHRREAKLHARAAARQREAVEVHEDHARKHS